VSADGLVCDDEDAPLALGMRARRSLSRPLITSRAQPPPQDARAEYDEDAETPPLSACDRGDHDRSEVDDRCDQEPERLGFASERVDHRQAI
jgi:hypothetical protein